MSRTSVWVLFLMLGLLGCGVGSAPKSANSPSAGVEQQGEKSARKAAGGAEAVPMGTPLESQMIIYTATLNVVVKDLDAAAQEVEKLVAGHKGFVSKSEL